MLDTRKLQRGGLLLVAALSAALLAFPASGADKKTPTQTPAQPTPAKPLTQAEKKAARLKKQQELNKKQQAQKKKNAAKADDTPAVEPAAPVFVAPKGVANARELASKIDSLITARLKEEKVPASPRSSDAEFLRRASLDITGVIPTAGRAKEFLDSTDPEKRAKLIDELLASPEYGKRMADLWEELLLTRTSENRRLNPAPFVKWLGDNFNANKPWNQMTFELLTASGAQDDNGAVSYFLANETVDKITDNVSKNILGVQLQCAQCHNHPFTKWNQTEYWGMATFFMKTQSAKINQAVKNGNSPGVTEARQVRKGKKGMPESAKIVPAKFLMGAEPKMNTTEPYRPVLARWVVAGDNPFFAKAMVNRLWFQYFGRGLVDPVDDMHDDNPASHPELMQEMTAGFVASGFDVKNFIRAVCLSDAYQRTSKPVAGNEDAGTRLFARAAIKVLKPEQLFDSLTLVSGPQNDNPKAAARAKAQKGRPGNGPRDQFVRFFQADDGADPTYYQAGIPQALRLMNANQFNRPALVQNLMRNSAKPEYVLEQLYLATLSRRPTDAEMTRLTAYVKKGATPREAYADVLWALLNSSEFALNR